MKIRVITSFLAASLAAVALSHAPATSISAQASYESDFLFFRDNVGFEAYMGSMKGAEGVRIEGSGNSLDRSLLLSNRLAQKGFKTRLAHGRLRGDALTKVIRLASGSALGDETGETLEQTLRSRLEEQVVDHYWVQVAGGKGWLDLDPTLPDAVPGRTIAPMLKFYEGLPAHLQQCLELEIHCEFSIGGTPANSRLLRFVGPVSSLLGHPLTLLFAHQDAEGNYRYSDSGGFKPVLFAGGMPQPAINLEAAVARASSQSGGAIPKLSVQRMWLEIGIRIPGQEPQIVQRLLHSDREPKKSRLSELIVFSLSTRRNWYGSPLTDAAALREAGRVVAALRTPTFPEVLSNSDQAAVGELLRAQREICRSLGGLLSSQIMETSRLLDAASGTTTILPSPRLLAVSLDPLQGRISTDIIAPGGFALPAAGSDTLDSATALFSLGIAATTNEGLLLRQLPGSNASDAVSGTLAAVGKATAWSAIDRSKTALLDRFRLSERSRRSMEAALTCGYLLVVPRFVDQDVPFWWQLDPVSGAVLGMTEPGTGGAAQDLPAEWGAVASAYKPLFHAGWPQTLAALCEAAAAQVESGEDFWLRGACLIFPEAITVVHEAITSALSAESDLQLSPGVAELFSTNGRLRLQAIQQKLCPSQR